jgi:hypothetical protein
MLWHVDSLLGNYREITIQQPLLSSGRNQQQGYGVFCAVRAEQDKLVELVRGLLRFSPCELLPLEAGS